MKGRDFFVGDIHGSFDLLNTLLDRVGFEVGKDRLWSVGDLIDRGDQSLEVVRFFRDTPGCEAVMGNHDAMFLFRQTYEVSRQYEPYAGWVHGHTEAETEEIADYLSTLPLTREVTVSDGRKVGIVHADMPDTAETFHADGSALEYGLSEHDVTDCDGRGERGKMLWSRRVAITAALASRSPSGQELSTRLLQRGIALETVHPAADLVISGHTPVRDRAHRLGNHLFLDTGACFAQGTLTLYDPVADALYMLRNIPNARLRMRPGPLPVFVDAWRTELKRRGEPLEEPRPEHKDIRRAHAGQE